MTYTTYRAALALGVAFALTACHQKDDVVISARPVIAPLVTTGVIGYSMTLPGEVQPRYTTSLSFRVGGKIIDRKVRLGDRVAKGQLLALLDSADLAKNTVIAQAQYEAAQHRFEFAKQQADRDRAQARENLIANAQLEQSVDTYATALAQRNQAAQQLGLAKSQEQYSKLVADHDGFITSELAEIGQNVAVGEAVYQLAWSGDVDIVTDVPDRALASVAKGQAAIVKLPALPGRSFDARVREIAPAADPQSRTYRVKLTVEKASDVRLGMSASVAFQKAGDAAEQKLITLPATALFHDGPSAAVWVVRPQDNTLELRQVSIARYGEDTIEVSEGIQAGERVVTQGAHTVSKGEKVRPIEPLHSEGASS